MLSTSPRDVVLEDEPVCDLCRTAASTCTVHGWKLCNACDAEHHAEIDAEFHDWADHAEPAEAADVPTAYGRNYDPGDPPSPPDDFAPF